LWPVADGQPACRQRPQQALAEPLVDSGTTSDQKKKPNEFWSEWQDSNLHPCVPNAVRILPVVDFSRSDKRFRLVLFTLVLPNSLRFRCGVSQ